MKQVQLVDSKNLDFTLRGDYLGTAYVARALSNDVSPDMGVGFARWEGASVSWTVLYDEVVFVIEGCFEVTANGKEYKISPGQLLWIPKGTELVYGGYAFFWYVVYPGNWKEIYGLNMSSEETTTTNKSC